MFLTLLTKVIRNNSILIKPAKIGAWIAFNHFSTVYISEKATLFFAIAVILKLRKYKSNFKWIITIYNCSIEVRFKPFYIQNAILNVGGTYLSVR